MPTYQRFEDLPVREEAIRLAEGCEHFLELTGNASPGPDGGDGPAA